MGLVQQGLDQLRHGVDQVGQGGGIVPAGDREAVLAGALSLAAAEGHQAYPDFLVIHLGHRNGHTVGQGTEGLRKGGKHGDGTLPPVKGDTHLGEKELGQSGPV